MKRAGYRICFAFLGAFVLPAQASADTLNDLVEGLQQIAQELESSPALKHEFAAFSREHGLANEAFAEYVRVKLVFEAARDGGYWGFLWDVTRKPPNSDAIWKQLVKQRGTPTLRHPIVVAECDELSAFFAFIVRRLGVERAGLVWPVKGHTVAVWEAAGKGGGRVKIVVPTSQVFLDDTQTLGTKAFRSYPPRRLNPYGRRDARPSLLLADDLVRFLLTEARRYGSSSTAELQRLRNARVKRLIELRGGS